MQTDIGAEIRIWRKKADKNQRDAANELGVDFSYLSKIENGHLVPSVDLISRMGTLYGRDVEEVDTICLERGSLPKWVKPTILNNPQALKELWKYAVQDTLGDVNNH